MEDGEYVFRFGEVRFCRFFLVLFVLVLVGLFLMYYLFVGIFMNYLFILCRLVKIILLFSSLL